MKFTRETTIAWRFYLRENSLDRLQTKEYEDKKKNRIITNTPERRIIQSN